MKRFKAISAYLATGLSSLALVVAPVAAATTTVVNKIDNSPSSGQWTTSNLNSSNTPTSGTAVISEELGAPEGFGDSSLKLSTPASGDKVYTGIAAPSNTLLSTLNNLSYFTYRSDASTGVATQTPAINIAVDINGPATGGFTTLVFEPVYQVRNGADPVAVNQWQEWDAGNTGIWWSSNPIPSAPNRDTFVTLEAIKADNPDAVVLGYAINQGSGNPGLIGGADGLTINENVYNFELPVENKDDCKNDGWRAGIADRQFKNQGDCVSHFASEKRANEGNPVVNFFKSIFNR